MPKTWKPGQEAKFAREVELNRPYYITYKIAKNLAPWEDANVYSEIVFTRRRRFLNEPITDSGADASTILRQHGPVHDTPPRGMRNIADAASVGAPLGENYSGVLDAAEIRGLEKRIADMDDPKKRRFGR